MTGGPDAGILFGIIDRAFGIDPWLWRQGADAGHRTHARADADSDAHADPTPPLGTGLACGLPAMPECGGPEGPPGVYGCCRNEAGGRPDRGEFSLRVDEAITILMGERPDLFDGQRVRDRVAYVNGVARVMEQRFRVCCKAGVPGDEIGCKNTNSYSEQYDIYLSNERVRFGGFVASCRPARF